MTNNISSLAKLIFTAGLTISLIACSSQIDSDVTNSSAGSLKPYYYGQFVEQECCTIIAHAGGGIDGNSYTNSREAITSNYNYGTRIFEIDFDLTSDGHWVAAHDWPNWKRQTEYEGETPPDLTTFNATLRTYKRGGWSINSKYTAMDMVWLENFLTKHPDAYIVTDMKEVDQFPAFVDTILKSPNRDQFIFQAYSIENIDMIKSRSEEAKIILTLYRIGYPEALFNSLADRKGDLIGITAPMSWALVDVAMQRLSDTGLPLYLHGAPSNINSRGLHSDFAAKGVNGFYLD